MYLFSHSVEVLSRALTVYSRVSFSVSILCPAWHMMGWSILMRMTGLKVLSLPLVVNVLKNDFDGHSCMVPIHNPTRGLNYLNKSYMGFFTFLS